MHERIRHHLTKKKFAAAVQLFSQALAEFPIFKKLEALSKEGFGREEDDMDGQDKEEGEKEEEGELDPIVAQLKTIFFLPLPAASGQEEASQDCSQAQSTFELLTGFSQCARDTMLAIDNSKAIKRAYVYTSNIKKILCEGECFYKLGFVIGKP